MYTKKVIDGIYEVTARYDDRLKYCPYGSCGVVFSDDGTVHLISYTTLVCSITKDGWMSCTGTYSRTTIKHIGAFLKEYAPNMCYYDAKGCYEGNYELNINTGEIIPLNNY